MQSQQNPRRPFSFPKESVIQKKLDANNTEYVERFRDSIMKCQTVTPDNRNTIVDLFDNDEYDTILDMFPKAEEDVFVMLIRQMNKTASKSPVDQVVVELFKYAIVENDSELLRKLISKTNGVDLFVYGTISLKNYIPSLIDRNMENMSELMYDIIFTEMNLTDSIAEIFSDYICKSNNVILLKKFISAGLKLVNNNILGAINNNAIDVIKIIISHGYDVQQIFNEVDIRIMKLSVAILLTLSECNIDITSQINNILMYAIESNKLDLVTYCVKHNTDCDINSALQSSCEMMHNEIIIYLLESGADINAIKFYDCYCNDVTTIKILIKYGLCIPEDTLDDVFSTCFLSEVYIDNITFLIDLGADPNYIFEREALKAEHLNYEYAELYRNPGLYHLINSYLELIISMGRITHIKFLEEINLEQLRLSANRLFIIACANGYLELIAYFLNLGADIHYENNLALTTACYFGHLNVVEYLLDNINLNNITENLLLITLYGDVERNNYQNRRYNIYNKLVNDNDIFRNDFYNYGNSSADIFELLVRRSVPIPSYDFLEILPKQHYTKEFVALLLLSGYDINSTFNMDCYRSEIILNVHAINVTILEVCIRLGKIDIVKLLLDNGADLSITVSSTNFDNGLNNGGINNESMLKIFNQLTAKENLSNNNSLLNLAEQLHDMEIKNLLLEYGAI